MICEVFGFDRSLAGWLIVLFREYTEPALNNLSLPDAVLTGLLGRPL
jgi:hypothetical protein